LKESILTKSDNLKDYFKEKPVFDVNEIREYFRRSDPNLKEATFKWRIHDLKQKGIIRSVKKGTYTFLSRPIFQPPISKRTKGQSKEIKNEFPYSKFCVWEIQWINELMIHLPGNYMTLVEVENEAAQSVFYFLQNRGKKENIYFKPSKKEIEQYIAANYQSTIVRPLITQSPTMEQEGICIPKLEKILVDLFVDKTLFIAYQGQELINIFENAYHQYAVNMSTLFRYAHRRKKRNQLKDFLQGNNIVPTELLD
jgi:hypothetical protein